MDIIQIFKDNKDNNNSISMKSYMKDNFEFLGIKKPKRNELQREYLKDISKKSSIDEKLVNKLWQEKEREFQYLALDYLVKNKKKLIEEDIKILEELIITKSWWDSIDIIASHLVGEICKKYPKLIEEYILKWSTDNNLWLRRTAILYQLKYKESTNTEYLERILKDNLNDKKEFFIDKAIGWALREYSKTNPQWVKKFIENNKLSNLSKREASKYI